MNAGQGDLYDPYVHEDHVQTELKSYVGMQRQSEPTSEVGGPAMTGTPVGVGAGGTRYSRTIEQESVAGSHGDPGAHHLSSDQCTDPSDGRRASLREAAVLELPAEECFRADSTSSRLRQLKSQAK